MELNPESRAILTVSSIQGALSRERVTLALTRFEAFARRSVPFRAARKLPWPRIESWSAGGPELSRRVVRCVTAGAAGEVYAGTDGGVFSSTDRGETWTARDEGLPRVPVYALAVDGASSALFAGTAQGLFRSTDGGSTWSRFPEAGLGVPVTSLFLDREANALLVGSFGAGVFAVPLPPPPSR